MLRKSNGRVRWQAEGFGSFVSIDKDFTLRYLSPDIAALVGPEFRIGQKLKPEILPIPPEEQELRYTRIRRMMAGELEPTSAVGRLKCGNLVRHCIFRSKLLTQGTIVKGIQIQIVDITDHFKTSVIRTRSREIEFVGVMTTRKTVPTSDSFIFSGQAEPRSPRTDRFGNPMPPRITKSVDSMGREERKEVFDGWRNYLSRFYNTKYKVQMIEEETEHLNLSDTEKAEYLGITRQHFNRIKQRLPKLPA